MNYVIKYDPEKQKMGKVMYYDVPSSFDIETTSFYTDSGDKCATMYLWGFNFNGRSVYGRTWEEFITLLKIIRDTLNTLENHLIIWVHNLSYEFQFMRKWLEWNNVFCMSDHEVAKALLNWGIEFRCSLLESGKKLSLLAEECKEFPIAKLKTLNYRGIRHYKTPLTDMELMYQLNDVRVVANYIYEKGKKRPRGIPSIQLTKTGYVRELYRKNALHNDNKNVSFHFRNLIRELTLCEEEYSVLSKAFQGGFTHANFLYIDDLLENVGSYDEISAYPAQFTKEFPMSKGEHYNTFPEGKRDIWFNSYCLVFRFEVWNIRRKEGVFDDPISESHCEDMIGEIINNGRVESADHLVTYITNVDYEIYKEFYDWDDEGISDIWRYRKGYLPKVIIETVLQLYAYKTQLKGVIGQEELYLLSKEQLNSSYIRNDVYAGY